VVELGEYRSPKVLEKIKSLASMTRHKYRPPYARGNIDVPRTASFIATTNTRHYLTDGTGNRRFYPVDLADIDRDIFADRPALFRELRAYYWEWARRFIDESDDLAHNLFSVRESDELREHLSEAREHARHVDATEEVITRYFDTVRRAVENGDFSELTETRPTHDYRWEYYSAFEALKLIYPNGRYPKDFYRVFAEVAEREGLTYRSGRIGGKRLRMWVPDSKPEVEQVTVTPPGEKPKKSEDTDHRGDLQGRDAASLPFLKGGVTCDRYQPPTDKDENEGVTRI
jgi:hypothetical protein